MTDTNIIRQLIEMFEKSGITDMELEAEGIKLKLGKKVSEASTAAPAEYIAPSSQRPQEKQWPSGKQIKSPLVGTYYRASSAGTKPFVSEGQQVKEGDVVCIVEAMKVMNEIKSPFSGTVTQILPADGDMVWYDDVLLIIEEN